MARAAWLGFCGYAPAEFFVRFVIPEGDYADGNQVCQIAVHMQEVELYVDDDYVEEDPERADGVEFEKAFHALAEGALVFGDVTESPGVVPDEIVEQGGFGGEDLAAGETPAEHPWIAQQEKDRHCLLYTSMPADTCFPGAPRRAWLARSANPAR